MANHLFLIVSGLLMVASAASGYGVPWNPTEYPITFWCGPPEPFHTPERFREIAEAGFTLISPPCTEGGPHGPSATVARNRAMLNLAHGAGLTAFIADIRLPSSIDGRAADLARVREVVDDYRGHPGLAGYSVKDEPVAGEFPGLAEVVAALRERDPDHPAWINLMPYTPVRPAWGAPDYEAYMDSFVQQVRPFTLSFDHYTFVKDGDAPTFIKNLAVAREVSLRYGIPFWNIVLLTEHGPYRNLTEPEIRYEAMQTLAYGAKGLVWFTYWTPIDVAFEWSHAMINPDGSRDPHYDMVKRVNWEVRAYGSALLKAFSEDVFHTGTTPMGGLGWREGIPVRVEGAAPPSLTVGVFRGPDGWRYALLANADYRASASLSASVDAGRVERMSPLSRRWNPVREARAIPGGVSIPIHLDPAAAVLLRWRDEPSGSDGE